jgi:hypothetical protein
MDRSSTAAVSMPQRQVNMRRWKRPLLLYSALCFGAIARNGAKNAPMLVDAFVVLHAAFRRGNSHGSVADHLRSDSTDARGTVAVASKRGKVEPISLPENEFSRKVQPERILKSRRDFVMDLEASESERAALAARFDLAEIGALHASVSLVPESTARGTGIQAHGSVTATVTQRCVRTGEAFQVDLEFPVEALVRPVRPLLSSLSFAEEMEDGKGMRESRSSQKSMRNNMSKKSDRSTGFNGMDLAELQGLLEGAENDGSGSIDSSSTTLMEDEAIYSTESLLDVGELISQLFWLQLDPYPKKGGSGPVQYSITG